MGIATVPAPAVWPRSSGAVGGRRRVVGGLRGRRWTVR